MGDLVELIMITDYKHAFRQGIKRYNSMNIDLLKKEFCNLGIDLIEYQISDVFNKNIVLANKFIIYTSSQNSKYKNYLLDNLYFLAENNVLIPDYSFLMAHENKGFQELLKYKLGIHSLSAFYFGGLKEVLDATDNIKFPKILKRNTGAGSSEVYKIDNVFELKKRIKTMNKESIKLSIHVKKFIKKLINKMPKDKDFYTEDRFLGGFILQEFIPNLDEDWKILVFYDKFFVLNRKVRGNDFRASGSGVNTYKNPPKEVLEFARHIMLKLDVPNVSLDIAFDGKKAYLIEFQAIHFGPITLINSKYYYTYQNKKWHTKKFDRELEVEYVRSVYMFLRSKGFIN